MMLKEKDSCSDGGGGVYGGGENSEAKPPHNLSEGNIDNPDEKTGILEKGIDFLRKSEVIGGGSGSKISKTGNSGSQELTLSYLCENSKLVNFPEKEVSGKVLLNSFEKVTSHKGKEVVSEDQNQDDNRWVERDFLQLNENRGNLSKREIVDEDMGGENQEKKPRLETLNLSLAPPDVSLSLAASNPLPNVDLPARLRSTRSVQSVAPSNNNTQTTYSNDLSAPSMSYSYSHAYSHNPSCSLTRNSTENYEYSVGRECDQIWNCGEGTNGSVHSRFRPIGDGVGFSNHGGGVFGLMQGNQAMNKENSLYRTTSSDNHSFFPTELPAKPRIDTQSGDSRGRGSEQHLRALEDIEGGRARKPSRPERILREIVFESIPVMSQVIQELTDETVESTKEYLKNLIVMPDKKDELLSLQKLLERRSDLTKETLSKSHQSQLEIMVAIKMGLASFLSYRNRLSTAELVEIFLFERCRNVNCKRVLPVDDCECKICLNKKGFCSECMCPVCFNFDCASNTCSWVGCDMCSHWCHAACGIRKNLIRPSPSLKGPVGSTEMQFHCLGCDHASEMFGFVKDVFSSCAKDWGLETLMKELDCVREIFRGSEDIKGKELHVRAGEMLSKLEKKMMSPSDVCSFIFQFFNYADGISEFSASAVASKDLKSSQVGLRQDTTPLLTFNSLPPKPSLYNMSSSSGRRDTLPHDPHQSELKASVVSDKVVEDEWSVKLMKKDEFDSLESIVRIKEAEARMFQSKADEARREAEGYRRMVRLKTEKLEEEYAEKLAKMCLRETEERRRKKLEELRVLENSHCDYLKMKLRMQADIASLLERMEATKQQWV